MMFTRQSSRQSQAYRSATGAASGPLEKLPVYIVLACALAVPAYLLIGASSRTLDGLWWFALVVVALLLVLMLFTGVMEARRVRTLARERTHRDAVRERMVQAQADPDPSAGRASLRALFPALATVRDASQSLPAAERNSLRLALMDAGADDWLLAQMAGARKKWERAHWLYLLGWLSSERTVGVLRDIFGADDPDLAYIAGQALRRQGTPAGYEVLSEALAAAWLPQSRVAALMETAAYENSTAALAEHVHDTNLGMRRWVAYLLGCTGDEQARELLLELTGDPDAQVRANSTAALSSLFGANTLTFAERQRFASRLSELLDDESQMVRDRAQTAQRELASRDGADSQPRQPRVIGGGELP